MKSCWVGCGGWRIRKFWKRGRNTLYQPSLHLSNNELYAFFSGKGDLLKIIYNAQLPPLESTTGCGISKHDYWYLITVSLTSSQISWLHMRLRRSLTSIQTAVIDDRAASVASRWQSVNNPLSNVTDRRKTPGVLNVKDCADFNKNALLSFTVFVILSVFSAFQKINEWMNGKRIYETIGPIKGVRSGQFT